MSEKIPSPPKADPYRGVKLLHDPLRNKGTAFSSQERDRLGLRGLLPPRVHTLEEQTVRVMENLRGKPTSLEKYIFLEALMDRNEMLFYRIVVDHLAEIMPLIYTPTVGQACQRFGHIFRRPRGMFLSFEDRGQIARILENWPHDDVRVIVVTDGERILGLGDLGADGMGIPIGKLALYSACAGIHPIRCLPITLDVGTNNRELLEDPLYIGLSRPRVRGSEYDEFVDEFITAVTERFPRALVQLEDFATHNAFHLLATYRDRICTFDDDIQGTGSVGLAGIYSALRLTGGTLTQQRLLFVGAGEAGTGIADMVSAAMIEEGLSPAEARRRCWLFDTGGLVVAGREEIAAHKRPYAHESAAVPNLLTAIDSLRPTAIIGAAGAGRLFDRSVLEAMAALNERPIIFALSNPTSKAECTAEEAYIATEGRAVFASGSPFAPVTIGDRELTPGQGNNAYIFPGVGLGVVVSQARRVTDEMFFAAAKTLAGMVSDADLAKGRIYPSLDRIRWVSARIAVAVAEVAYERGLAGAPRPDDLGAFIADYMFEPDYSGWP